MKSFSVLMSVYQRDDPVFFSQALQSVLVSADFIDQIVIVRDGPIPTALELIIAEFETRFTAASVDFIALCLEVNQGLGMALRHGTAVCTGDYIVRMDSDDICSSDRFSRLLSLVGEFPLVDVIGAQIEEFIHQPGDHSVKRVVPCNPSEIVPFSKLRNPVNHVTACIKRSSLVSAGGYRDVLWHEDYYLWLTMLNLGMTIKNVDEVHVNVRVAGIGNRRGGLAI